MYYEIRLDAQSLVRNDVIHLVIDRVKDRELRDALIARWQKKIDELVKSGKLLIAENYEVGWMSVVPSLTDNWLGEDEMEWFIRIQLDKEWVN